MSQRSPRMRGYVVNCVGWRLKLGADGKMRDSGGYGFIALARDGPQRFHFRFTSVRGKLPREGQEVSFKVELEGSLGKLPAAVNVEVVE